MCSRQVTRLLLRSASVTKDSAIAASCDEPFAAGRVGRTPRGGSTQSATPYCLVLVWKNCLGFSVGYQRAPDTSEKKKNTWYQRALRCQLRGRPFHPWAGRLRFSGAATSTQSSSCSCGPASKVKADCCCAVLPQCTCLLMLLL